MSSLQSVSKEDFNQVVLENELPVLVDFSTDGCGPCELVIPILEDFQEELKGKIAIYNHNVAYEDLVNDANDVVKKYDVMGFPTLMVFKDGEAVTSIIGNYDKDDILEKVQNVLKKDI